MKGKELTASRTRGIEDGTKVWAEDVYGRYANQVCIKNGFCLNFTERVTYYNLRENGSDLNRIRIYEWIEEPIKNERRNNIMKNAVVKFPNTSKQYYFMTDLDLETGDMVVCDTAVGVTVATIVRLEEEVSPPATKWIIGKVDMAVHTKRMELEAKKKDLKARMEKRRKKLEDIAVFAILAKEDPDMAELLKEYQEINN